jgi:hypothetical protein
MEIVGFGGWDRCARLVSGDVEILVTLQVGPRVIRLGFVDGPNEFYTKEQDLGQVGGDQYRSYGGHRLWTAPEDPEFTYVPDNETIEVLDDDGSLTFSPKVRRTDLRKALRITPTGNGSFSVAHLVTNHGTEIVSIAPWALSVMAPGGTCLIPQEPFVPHGKALHPARPITLWTYTKMDDPRFTWGPKLIRIRQEAIEEPTKIGALVKQGYVAYSNQDRLFVKRFAFDEGAEYPDYNSNVEVFTRHDMLEVETLGPLVDLFPGQTAVHLEEWTLSRPGIPPDNEDDCAEWLAKQAAQ